jgi:hypothetical protein
MRAPFAVAAILAVAFVSLAQAEVKQQGNLRVFSGGDISRKGSAPVKIAVSAKIAAVKGSTPPQLRKVEIAINRHGRLEPQGLPVCQVADIQPSTTEKALAACRGSLVGQGRFSAKVLLPEQTPFPSVGKVYAFNGAYKGKPAILAHVYGTSPAPTSVTLPFVIGTGRGTFGTTLSASLPTVTSEWGYVTGISMTLQRRFSFRGKARSFAVAGCPAPEGFPGAVFPFAKATYGFAGGRTLSSTLVRSCRARG